MIREIVFLRSLLAFKNYSSNMVSIDPCNSFFPGNAPEKKSLSGWRKENLERHRVALVDQIVITEGLWNRLLVYQVLTREIKAKILVRVITHGFF